MCLNLRDLHYVILKCLEVCILMLQKPSSSLDSQRRNRHESAYCNTGLKPPQLIFPSLVVGYTADLFVKNVNDMLFNQQLLFMGIVIKVLYLSHYFPFIYTFCNSQFCNWSVSYEESSTVSKVPCPKKTLIAYFFVTSENLQNSLNG